MFDGGPNYLNLPNRMGYTLSIDGKNWSKARYIAIDTKVKKWWTVMRTPLCLIPEGDNVYTIVYTAWDPRLTLVRPTLVPVGISIIIRDTVYPLSLPPIWRVTKQHRQLSWRCEIRQSGGSRLAR